MFPQDTLKRFGFLLWLWAWLAQVAVAQLKSGIFTYQDNGDTLTITQCASTASGAVEIPAAIGGKPVTRIGAQAFAFCTGINSVRVPEGVIEISDGAFLNCTGLTAISLPASLRSLGTSALYSCSNLVEIEIPDGIASVSPSLLGNCRSLTRVVLPAGITSIGASAFSGCVALTRIDIPAGVKRIESYAFFSCSALAEVSLPEGLEVIALKAFADCVSLAAVEFPTSLVQLGDNAFTGCTALAAAHLPASVNLVGIEVFRSCPQLPAITVDPANQAFSSLDGVLFNKARSSLLAFPCGRSGAYVVPGGVTSIGASAFRNSNVAALTLPASLTNIGSYAVASCKSLTSVTIPAGVDSVGNSAFRYNSAMTGVTFAGNAPASFGSYVFSSAAVGFTVFYYQSVDGFSSPTWKGYPTSAISISNDPARIWLVESGMNTAVDLDSDDNHDGVSVLMAYALDLGDPNQNLAGRMPQPVLAGNQLSMSFYSGASGVTYRVETSGNLRDWTTDGVTISEPDATHVRKASVPFTGGARYLRLVVSYDPQPAS